MRRRMPSSSFLARAAAEPELRAWEEKSRVRKAKKTGLEEKRKRDEE